MSTPAGIGAVTPSGSAPREYKASGDAARKRQTTPSYSPITAALRAMAATVCVCATSALAAPSVGRLDQTSFAGTAVQGLPAFKGTSTSAPALLRVEARTRKVIPREPLGPSGDLKLKKGVDAGGRVPKGKGVYQFTKKYGANVDGYSPIYDEEEWSKSGDVYAAGTPGLAIWAALLGGILLGGALLVYNTSALAP